MLRQRIVDRVGEKAWSNGRADQQLKRVHVLREQRRLLREVGLGLRKDLLRLVEVESAARCPPSSRIRVMRTLSCALFERLLRQSRSRLESAA